MAACSSLWPCWFDGHEGAGAWLSAGATFLAVVVALVLPFLTGWRDRINANRLISWHSCLAAHHARGVLLLIMDLQRELFAIGQNPLNKTIRQWPFELRVADDALALSMKAEIRDPALLPLLIAVHHWAAMALRAFDLGPKDGLFELQYSTEAREAAASDLLRLQHQLLEMATLPVVRRIMKRRPKP